MMNFGPTQEAGEVIRKLSQKGDTMFLDGADDLIYWQAKIASSYRYSWYTSYMPKYELFRKARLDMFAGATPVFYYDPYPNTDLTIKNLPARIQESYTRLTAFTKPSKLYILTTKIGSVTPGQWQAVKELGYSLPE